MVLYSSHLDINSDIMRSQQPAVCPSLLHTISARTARLDPKSTPTQITDRDRYIRTSFTITRFTFLGVYSQEYNHTQDQETARRD
ncbi:hypothetical protein JMJ77_0001631 [Colletotrichum scovillei]|uniref:Uncharacterized protein n=1 Tax=Colletotrichum scovillei TaxID=1209932 RepID=A0A9P7UFT2_9PEZI|nr:hypothetical protein JMJ77_0001631 [Colletotrichum scovillei]KAG7070040.1 hypothetical protein JMJ76_0001298 [Colletotrichum scovillei]KAG7078266.1 hypothetical protein JMJ78_0001940 [Colletotrichum scovillei]